MFLNILLGYFKSTVDVWTDILFAEKLVELILDENLANIFVDTREDDIDAVLVAEFDEVLEVVHTC